jgi:hypothetical protein
VATLFKSVKDNVSVALNGAQLSGDATWTVQAGQGAQFPAAPFFVSCDSEVAICTSRAGDVLTVTRGQDGTAAAGHNAGALVEIRPIAGLFADLATAINNIENGVTALTSLHTTGNAGIAAAVSASIGAWITPALSGAASQFGVIAQPTSSNGATAGIDGIFAAPATAAAAFTATACSSLHAGNPATGAGSTIASKYGVLVDSVIGTANGGSASTACYGVLVNAPTGASGENLGIKNLGGANVNGAGTALAFFGNTPIVRPTTSGSRGGNAALANLLTILANFGLITDGSTA